MGIFGALTTAVGGMRAQSFALENVSGNIANSQTTAFKRIDTSLCRSHSRQHALEAARRQRDREFALHQHRAGRHPERVDLDLHGDQRRRLLRRAEAARISSTTIRSLPASRITPAAATSRSTRTATWSTAPAITCRASRSTPTTGNLVGSVPQLLQFQNDFLPAQQTTTDRLSRQPRAHAEDQRLRRRRRRLRIAQSGGVLGQPAGAAAAGRARSPASARRLLADAAVTVDGTAVLPGTLVNGGTFTINGTQRRARRRRHAGAGRHQRSTPP